MPKNTVTWDTRAKAMLASRGGLVGTGLTLPYGAQHATEARFVAQA